MFFATGLMCKLDMAFMLENDHMITRSICNKYLELKQPEKKRNITSQEREKLSIEWTKEEKNFLFEYPEYTEKFVTMTNEERKEVINGR